MDEDKLHFNDYVGLVAGFVVAFLFWLLTHVVSKFGDFLSIGISFVAGVAAYFIVRSFVDPRTKEEIVDYERELTYTQTLTSIRAITKKLDPASRLLPATPAAALQRVCANLRIITDTGDDSLVAKNDPEKATILLVVLQKFYEGFATYLAILGKRTIIDPADAKREMTDTEDNQIPALETAVANIGKSISSQKIVRADIAEKTFQSLLTTYGLIQEADKLSLKRKRGLQ